ncbi:MAG: hypothetical protein JXR65_10750 [Bacteroidales bacterium]|nr:hypothetical protein [Bacteroidales bacterium]
MRKGMFLFLFNVFLLIAVFVDVEAQYYGLGFNGQEEGLDARTEFNLSPEEPFQMEGDLELGFKLMIRPSIQRTYGYVLRIVDKNNFNIDILNSFENGQFYLYIVHGNNDAAINIPIEDNLVSEWIDIRLKLLVDAQKFILYTPDTFYVVEQLPLIKTNSYRITFGASKIDGFCTTDVPSMSIKDVRLFNNGHEKYFWPLDELNGCEVFDQIERQKALVRNPCWLKSMHSEWRKLFNDQEKGGVVVATDRKNDRLFFIGEQQLKIVSLGDNAVKVIEYKNRPVIEMKGCQAVFDQKKNCIFLYDIDVKQVSEINVKTGEWIGESSIRNYATTFLHHNKVYCSETNTLLVFGGYGRHTYKNLIQSINLKDKNYRVLNIDAGVYSPRYMAGLGSLNDTIFIFGGYGSESGNQMINPRSSYELLTFCLKDSCFDKRHDVRHLIPDMCVANSLYIDAKTRQFYALAFNKANTNGSLKLLRGELDSPDIEIVGSEVPYSFFDINSYADLYYSEIQSKLYAITTYLNQDDITQVEIFSINYPPFALDSSAGEDVETAAFNWILSSLLFVLLGSVVYFMIYRYKIKSVVKGSLKNYEDSVLPVVEDVSVSIDNGEIESCGDVMEVELIDAFYNVSLFGGFQIFSSEKRDVTSGFTPLLKELFLLVWLFTYKNNRGISSDKVCEILWPDKTEKSAKNNIAVNFAKLRTLLSEIGDVELSRKAGYWKVIFNESCLKSDYLDFLKLTESKIDLNLAKIEKLIEILKRGAFLQNVEYVWLDDFKALVSDRIVETLVAYVQKHAENNPEVNIDIANCIFSFDVVNEEALIMKCKAQCLLGQHGLAKKTYDSFIKEYMLLYGEEYSYSFNETVSRSSV